MRDGTGRDSYIAENNGGNTFLGQVFNRKSDKIFAGNLRNYERDGDYLSRYQRRKVFSNHFFVEENDSENEDKPVESCSTTNKRTASLLRKPHMAGLRKTESAMGLKTEPILEDRYATMKANQLSSLKKIVLDQAQ